MYAVTVSQVAEPLGVLMDIEKGIYSRRGTLISSTGAADASYEMRWYAHRTERSLYILEVDTHTSPGSVVTLHLQNDVPFESVDFNLKLPMPIDGAPNASLVCGVTTIAETPSGSLH